MLSELICIVITKNVDINLNSDNVLCPMHIVSKPEEWHVLRKAY